MENNLQQILNIITFLDFKWTKSSHAITIEQIYIINYLQQI